MGSVAISAPQFSSTQQSFVSEMGPCFYIEVCILILFDIIIKMYIFYLLTSLPSTADLPDIVQPVAGGALLRLLQEGLEDQLPGVERPGLCHLWRPVRVS